MQTRSIDAAPQPSNTAPREGLWGADGFGFDDLVDIINPLQHLPVVGQAYRALTGDEIGHLPRLAGGFLFGGVTGLGMAMLNVGIEAGTGKDLAEHTMDLVLKDEPAELPRTAISAYVAATAAGDGMTPAPPPSHLPAIEPAAGARRQDGADRPSAAVSVAAAEAPGWVDAPTLNGARERLLAEVERHARMGPKSRSDLVV